MRNNQSEMPCHVLLTLLFVVQKETIITHIVTNGSPSLHVTHHVLLNGRNTTRNNQAEMSCHFMIILLIVQK